MDRKLSQKAAQTCHSAFRIALPILLLTPMNLVGCSRQQPDAKPGSQQASPAKSSRAEVKLTCPPGDPFDNDASSSPVGAHSVSLSWNPSTSSNNPKGREIQYCLYRTKGGRVQASTSARSFSPCVNCLRVTKEPVMGTTYDDTHLENDSRYCYVAISVETVNSMHSDFSNQTEADIPRAGKPVSTPISSGTLCNPKVQHDKSTAKQRHH